MTEQLKNIHSSLTLELAAKIIDGAIAIRRREKMLPLAVAVLDAGAQLVAFKREDGCGVMRFDIALGKAHGASINDVVLWLCSTALRGYLNDLRELPAASLVAGVPVSLRSEGDTSMNNQVTMSLVDLATQEADPLKRLKAIQLATASM